MLKFAVNFDGPIAIRYPRGEAYDGLSEFRAPMAYGKSEVLYDEAEIALLACGQHGEDGRGSASRLSGAGGYQLFPCQRAVCETAWTGRLLNTVASRAQACW